MKRDSAIVFGYNEFSKQIAQQVYELYTTIHLFVTTHEEKLAAQNDGLHAELIELSDDWHMIPKRFRVDRLIAFCALADDAENVFLSISLRATFETLFIIAIAQDTESMLKMKSAGANQVIPSLQIVANVIEEMLDKPILTQVLDEILYENEGLSIREMRIHPSSLFVGMFLHDIHFKRDFNIILLAIVDQQSGETFSFASGGENHQINPHDLFVVVGYPNDLDILELQTKGTT